MSKLADNGHTCVVASPSLGQTCILGNSNGTCFDPECQADWQVIAAFRNIVTQTYLKGTIAAVHRIDLPCAQTGFTTPPHDVHLKFLPSPATNEGWTLLAHAAAGKPDALARWLTPHPLITDVRVAPGIAPKMLRARASALPPEWATVASYAKVHHLNLAPNGNAAWFVEGARDQVLALVHHLESTSKTPGATEVRCRPVVGSHQSALITRRQFEALATAVSLGYYEIPHRLDLRQLATRTGLSLGSVSELLRRAEAAILTHYIDASLLGWPLGDETPPNPFRPVVNLLRHSNAPDFAIRVTEAIAPSPSA